MGARGRIRLSWSPPQRGVLIALVLILSLLLLVRLYRNRAYISNPQPPQPARFDELVDQLDPNVATWQELSVLPQIGEKRAKEIVAYRDEFQSRGSGTVAFARAEDLMKVKGFGVAMVATVRPYLTFPSMHSTTKAATTRSI
jgi:hypothetical protein